MALDLGLKLAETPKSCFLRLLLLPPDRARFWLLSLSMESDSIPLVAWRLLDLRRSSISMVWFLAAPKAREWPWWPAPVLAPMLRAPPEPETRPCEDETCLKGLPPPLEVVAREAIDV